MKKNPTPSVFLPLGLWLFLVLNATAQKPPELGYVYPPAVTFGKTEVRLGGYDFTGDMQFFVHKEGIQLQVHGPPGPFLLPPPPYWFGEKGRLAALPIPREIRATLTIPPDHPPGPVRWQVANANGSSTTALFYVSDIREVVESRYRTDPQQLKSLPVGVSGRLSRISEIDRYGFRATRSGPITVELFARSLGANFNGVIEVRNQSGKLVADAADTEGTDTGLTFVAEAGQNYRVHLHDVDFRGSRAFVYRLAIRPGPRVVATLPAVGQRGTRREVEWIGLGLASGKPRLESIRREIAFPGTGSPDTLDFLLETSFGTVPHRFPLHSQPQQVRSDSLTPQRLSLPAGVSGRMKRAGAEFVWAAQKGKHYCLAARSQALGGRLDLSLEVVDPTGKKIASNDDFSGSADPVVRFQASADGDFTCRLWDLAGNEGAADAIYHLSLEEEAPGYTLRVPQQLNIKLGGKATLQVTVQRTGGHQAPIPIQLEGLPEGITAPPPEKRIVPEGKSKLAIELQSSKQMAARAAAIRIFGQTEGEPPVPALAKAAGNLCQRNPMADLLDHVLLATTLSPSFSVELVDKNRQRAVHRGTTYPAPFLIQRHEGFDGAIELQMLARQGRHRQGIDAPVLPVPEGATRVLYPCYMPEWLETDRTTRMVVLGVGRQKDPLGNVREITQQADARITMILEGALLQVAHDLDELTIRAGETFEVPLVVSRSPKLKVPVELQLMIPPELEKSAHLKAGTLKLSPSQNRGNLRVTTSRSSSVVGRWPLTIRAKALQEGRWPVIAQTSFSVQIDAAPTGEAPPVPVGSVGGKAPRNR